jgi:voltage-gated potassium channel
MLIRRFIALLLVPALVICIGTFGYVLIEGWTPFDSLYMTVMTITTVGFGEVRPLSRNGRMFTIFLMLGGIFTLFYAVGEVIRTIVSGQLQAALGRQRMERSLAGMKDHMIVCGYGRMGRLVCKEFASEHIPFVVVEKNPDFLEHFHNEFGLPIHGDATLDDTLRQAGIDRARALVTLVASDADNLYITMSARLLSDKIFIVARAEDERDEQKLVRAGANRVVSPYLIGGSRVAQAVLRPTVVDFIELATKTEHLEIQIEEIQIGPSGRLTNAVLKDSQVRQQFGVIIVAIKKASGKMIFNPPGEAVMEAGDILIVLGNREQLDQLEMLAKGP